MIGMNKKTADPKRYVKNHGNGVTNFGIERAMKLLPAMRAIGDPENGSGLTADDLQDVQSCLKAYQKEGKLTAEGRGGMLFSDMGVYDSTDYSAVNRLNLQDMPDGTTKYRAAFQAVPLAMTPSEDLASEGYWHLISDMAATRNMEAHTDQEAAGRSLQAALEIDPKAGVDGMAEKMATCWWGLNNAAPCELNGTEGSVRMMQFCAMQNIAHLDGYDLMPDEDHAKEMGRMLANGLDDLDGFKKVLAKSLVEHAQPQAQKAEPDRPSAFSRLMGMMGHDDKDDSKGFDGPEL